MSVTRRRDYRRLASCDCDATENICTFLTLSYDLFFVLLHQMNDKMDCPHNLMLHKLQPLGVSAAGSVTKLESLLSLSRKEKYKKGDYATAK